MTDRLRHRCTESECCYTGQPSATSCGCHRTREQMADARIERLEAINAELIDQVAGLSTAPWPAWAEALLTILREWTGPCPEDAVEGIELPEELRIWLEGYRDEMQLAKREGGSDA